MAGASDEVLLTSAAGAGPEVSRLEERLREAEADPERESEGVARGQSWEPGQASWWSSHERAEMRRKVSRRLVVSLGAFVLKALKMGRRTAWFDTGTPQDLLEAANLTEAIQRRQGLIIGCPEEVAYRQGFIDHDELMARTRELPACAYRDYLEQVAEDLV